MVRAHEQGYVIAALMAFGGFAASCKAPTEAKAGSCGEGSQTLSVVPQHAELDAFTKRRPQATLEGLTGVGGCLTYRKPTTGAAAAQGIKVCDFDQVHKPVDQRFPLCTAHFRKHGDPVNGKQRLLVWTSRNCLDYRDSNVEFFVEFFSDGKPIKVQLPRMKWPDGIRAQLAAEQDKAFDTTAKEYSVSEFADVHNFERFIIELPLDQWGPSTSAAAGAAPNLGQRLQEVFDAQAKRVAEMRASQNENTQLLQKWLLLTEKQAVLGVMQAASRACPSGATGGCRAPLEKDLNEEFVAALQHYGSSDVGSLFRNMWYENKIWANISRELDSLAIERQGLFVDLFSRVRGLSVPTGGAQAAPGKSSGVTFSGGVVEDLALIHGYRQEADANGLSGVISYQGLPMSSLFALGANVAPSEASARGITFSNKLSYGPEDEGQMISLFGIAPVAFVSSKQVQRGKFTGSALPLAGAKRTGVYRATGCN